MSSGQSVVLGLRLICLEVKSTRVPTRGLEKEKAEGGANVPRDLETFAEVMLGDESLPFHHCLWGEIKAFGNLSLKMPTGHDDNSDKVCSNAMYCGRRFSYCKYSWQICRVDITFFSNL